VLDGKIIYGAGKFESLAPPALPVIPTWSPAAYYKGYGGAKKNPERR
jgi:hypothetical protein